MHLEEAAAAPIAIKTQRPPLAEVDGDGEKRDRRTKNMLKIAKSHISILFLCHSGVLEARKPFRWNSATKVSTPTGAVNKNKS